MGSVSLAANFRFGRKVLFNRVNITLESKLVWYRTGLLYRKGVFISYSVFTMLLKRNRLLYSSNGFIYYHTMCLLSVAEREWCWSPSCSYVGLVWDDVVTECECLLLRSWIISEIWLSETHVKPYIRGLCFLWYVLQLGLLRWRYVVVGIVYETC